jgi:ATP-dependent Clp protease protease subunit
MERKSPLRVEANADAGMATMYLYDEIGPAYYGLIDAASVISALAQFNGLPINLRINSPGGDVFEGFAIYNALQRHNAPITVDIDALCASIATVVALAGDKVRIASNAMFMVHNAWTIAAGNAGELRKTADMLDQVDQNIVATYVAKTGLPLETLNPMMAAETWMTADVAVAKGFCQEVGQPLNVSASIGARRFKNMPAELVTPKTEAKPPAPRAVELVAVRNRALRQRTGAKRP